MSASISTCSSVSPSGTRVHRGVGERDARVLGLERRR